MSNTNTGGNAFPHPHSLVRSGMTLRDYFAAKAMQMHGATLHNVATNGPEEWDALVAERAYRTADAMLKAREA